MKIIYELDTDKDPQADIEMMHMAPVFRVALREIDNKCRERLKYGPDGPIESEFLEEIRRMIGEVGID